MLQIICDDDEDDVEQNNTLITHVC